MHLLNLVTWDYGIAIGVILLLFIVGFWMIRALFKEVVRADIVTANHKETLAAITETNTIVRATNKAIVDELNERDRACDADHKGLVAEVQRLNENLAELTGMLTFILDHYIRNNGSNKTADGEQ